MKLISLIPLIFTLLLSFSSFISHGAEHRVVALAPHLSDWMIALKAEGLLVGISEAAGSPDKLAGKAIVANHNGANLETILTLKPTLVLGWGGGNKLTDLNRLKQFGLNVYVSSPVTYDDMTREIAEIATLIDKAKTGANVVSSFEQELNTLRLKYQDKPEKSVFFQLWHTPMTTIGPGSWPEQALAVCRGKNLFDDVSTPYPTVSAETVVRRNPDAIVFSTADDGKALFSTWQKFPEMTIVKNNRYITIHPDLLHRLTPDVITGVKKLCAGLHLDLLQ